jgi:ABC-type transport system involved in multi-copper enzyme maturation permease subunit
VIDLFASEVLRMYSRRLVRFFILVGLIIVVVASVVVAVRSHRPTPGTIAQARQEYQQELQACMNGEFGRGPIVSPSGPTGSGPTGSGPTGGGGGTNMTAQQCIDSGLMPPESEFIASVSNEFTTVDLADSFMHTSLLMILMAMVIGASSIGAEWGYGSISTLLTWEPRRSRVLLIRALVVAITVALVAFLVQALLGGGLYLAAALRGSTAGSNGAWLAHVLSSIGRVTLISTIVAIVSFAVAAIGRNTAAALGALVAYLAIFESILRGFRPVVTPWLLGSSVVTYITGSRQEVFTPDKVIYLTPTHSLVVSAGYGLVLLVVALIFFRGRDVN